VLRLTAFIAPVLLSLLWAGWLLAPRPHTGVPEAARALDARLDRRAPDVLVLGNSAASRGIDDTALSRLLGVRAQTVGMSGTLGPTWYVILRDRVFPRNLSPRLVVIAGTPPGMLATRPSSPRQHNLLRELAMDDDPLGGGLRARSAAVRTGLVDGLRNTAVGLLFALRGPGTLQARGKARADAAVAEVLGEGGTAAQALSGALQPITTRLRPDELPMVQGSYTESFADDLVDLAEDHQTTLVFVHLPRRGGRLDPGSAAGRSELVPALNARRVPYIDLSQHHTAPSNFMDANHLTTAGRAAMTETLAEALRPLLAGDAGFTPASTATATATLHRAPAPPRIAWTHAERVDDCTYVVGAPRSLSADTLRSLWVHTPPTAILQDGTPLRRTTASRTEDAGCSGTFDPTVQPMIVHPTGPDVPLSRLRAVLDDAIPLTVPIDPTPLTQYGAGTVSGREVTGVWVYPGTTVQVRIQAAIGGSAPRVRTSALVVSGAGADATLQVSGSAVPLRAEGRLLSSGEVPGSADPAWTVQWASPAGGPSLLVRDVVLVEDGRQTAVVGTTDAATAVTASFLPSHVAPVRVTYASPPPALTDTWLPLPRKVESLAGKKACLPVAIDRDDTLRAARVTRTGIEAVAPAGSAGTPVLHPQRRCTHWPAERTATQRGAGPLFMEPLRTARWLLPGDEATFTRRGLPELHGLARTLVLEATRFGPPTALHLEVRTKSGDHRFTLPVKEGTITETLTLPAPLDPVSIGRVRIRMWTEPDDPGLVYVTDLHMAEAAP